ncbi:hypothetical protein [Neobacillus sp. Marseille-QA0830]
MKKAIKSLLSLVLLVSLAMPVSANAAGFSGGPQASAVGHTYSTKANSPQVTQVKTLRRSGSSYRSGYRAPSSSVRKAPSTSQSPYTNTQPTTKSTSGFWKGAALFGAGSLFGSMFHPFGGYYGGMHTGFSLMGLLFDILLIVVIVSMVKRIFRRRY